jgi:glycogen operon protein
LKGIDNASYYRLVNDDPRHYIDFTGCGNTLNMRSPQVLQLIMDSLRYWVLEMHVDGFRFDLASALARELFEVDRLASFFDIIHQDPVLSQVKLIAEPWDLGQGGYQVGNFPVLWTEWNGKYRDTVRRFWRGDGGTVSELATRLSGSNDLYAHSGRKPYASINFVTAHDGFTLNDLVSYNEKHNEANLENNGDGESNNLSFNHGVEGTTDDPGIAEVRRRQTRNFLATLLLSQGVPMISHGDELARTQQGNNNAYCQDNELSWIDWTPTPEKEALGRFVAQLVHLRQAQPVLQRRRYFHGRDIRGGEVKDVAWLAPDGHEMADEAWNADFVRSIGMLLSGHAIEEVDERGDRITGDTLLILLNAHTDKVPFTLPPLEADQQWQRLVDTIAEHTVERLFKPGIRYPLQGRSVAVFRLNPPLRERRRSPVKKQDETPELVGAAAEA